MKAVLLRIRLFLILHAGKVGRLGTHDVYTVFFFFSVSRTAERAPSQTAKSPEMQPRCRVRCFKFAKPSIHPGWRSTFTRPGSYGASFYFSRNNLWGKIHKCRLSLSSTHEWPAPSISRHSLKRLAYFCRRELPPCARVALCCETQDLGCAFSSRVSPHSNEDSR